MEGETRKNRGWVQAGAIAAMALLFVACAAPRQVETTAGQQAEQADADSTTQATQALTPTDSAGINTSSVLDTLIVPAGVDTSVAYSATIAAQKVLIGPKEDSLANLYAEMGKREKELADPLLELLKKGETPPPEEVAPDDTLKALELSFQAEEELQKGDQALGKPVGEFASEEELRAYRKSARRKAAKHYENAREYLKQALEFNPWQEWSRSILVQVYEDLAFLHQSLDNLDDAIRVNEFLIEYDRSNYAPVANQAYYYQQKADTLEALKLCRRAEDLLLSYAEFDMGYITGSNGKRRTRLTSQQYDTWLYLVDWQSELLASLKLGEDLIANSHRLLAMARPEVEADTIYANRAKSDLAWIMWDNGNIESAITFQEINSLWNAEKYPEAREAIRELLPKLSAPQAIFRINYMAVILDFRFLGEPEAALERMRRMLRDHGITVVDSSLDDLLERKGANGFAETLRRQQEALDDTWREAVDTYGTMCLNYANTMEVSQRNKYRAFKYYYQAALVPSEGTAQALLKLADLSRRRPDMVILYGEAALAPGLPAVLPPELRKSCIGLLIDAYRRKNDRNMVERYYAMLENLSGGEKAN